MRWFRNASSSVSSQRREQPKIPVDFPATVRRANHLIKHLGLKRYLEIGLGNGGTFDAISASEKVGVDPHPWNPGVKDLPGVEIATSDDYFARHWDSGEKFDLILLDGLHTAEQTYRDFVNSLHYAHERTIWLIDDVLPNDRYSAIPDYDEAINQRKAETGSEDRAWHGDVYKIVWMIRAFHPNMRLRTFGPEQPQSIVYSAPPTDAVMYSSLREIAALSYADCIERRAEYKMEKEAAILEECVRRFR